VSARAPLIGAAALAALREPGTVLDVRWALGGPPGREEYLRGHIPGARFVDLDTELAGPPGAGGRHPLPDVRAFETAMRAAGVSGHRGVVVYDAGNSIAAARAWWLLRYFGHPHVAVLDGGLAAWVAAGNPLETGPPALAPRGDFAARAGGMPTVDAGGAARVARDGVLLDARAPERFRGEIEPVDPVAGHIPRARNRPAQDNLEADGRFRAPEALRAEFEQLGAGEGVALGAYCGSGVAAAHAALALELAGFEAAVYPGSWSEWVTDPERPVEIG
jgi:thiosulfate/3-mercaptopyruvate sulfurtransferase